MNTICPHCNLCTSPLNYHEGAQDCQEAARKFVEVVKMAILSSQPFYSAWEFDSAFRPTDAVELHKKISESVGIDSDG